MINPTVVARADALRESFLSARPFRHITIEVFLDEEVCQRLLDDFPAFEERFAINEFGEVGKKAVVPGIAAISEQYREFYTYINSKPFLNAISELTGIDSLLPDPDMYGGGTHENREGQNLDAHVDFNYSQDRRLHRRLNLLLYLNTEWSEDWGGCIELHSNPRNPDSDTVKSYLPLFNQAVIFETNEHSWHGFKTIRLPADKKHLSRKCISIYLYTKSRPEDEVVPEHGTFYVQDPMPKRFSSGYTLSEEDVTTLKTLLKDRDDFIRYYQNQELEKNRTINEVTHHLDTVTAAIRLPITGYVKQKDAAKGFWHDNWVSDKFSVTLIPQLPVSMLLLHGYHPPGLKISLSCEITCGGYKYEYTIPAGNFTLELNLAQTRAIEFELNISTSSSEAMTAGIEPGGRPLVFLLSELECRHSKSERSFWKRLVGK